MRQLAYIVFVITNDTPFHLWRKENLTKNITKNKLQILSKNIMTTTVVSQHIKVGLSPSKKNLLVLFASMKGL